MVLFKKDSIGRNIPSQDTLVSQNHRVYLGKHLVRAKYLINNRDIVKEVMDTKTVYNVIMDQSKAHKMRINNMLVETMKPIIKKKILPEDFNWKVYTQMNPDLTHLDKNKAEKHYLRYGKREKRAYKSKPHYANRVPEDFNWEVYTYLHEDLKDLNEQKAIKHYLRHGIKENRAYAKS